VVGGYFDGLFDGHGFYYTPESGHRQA
jgi:hypothetical protein